MGNTQQKLKDEKSEPPQEPDSDLTCEICIEPIEANKKFNNRGICKHDICSDCIAKYIEAKVVEFNIANIGCPALDCKFFLDPLSSRPIISNHLFDKWCDLLCGAAILEYYSNNRSVYCPYRDCSALIVNECNDKPTKSTCPNCKNNFCFRCKSQWHAGFRCGEKRKFRDRNDVLAGQLIEDKKWKRCPKCGHAVERNGGCLIIRCRCGHEFCHSCGKSRTMVGRPCCKQMREGLVGCFIYLLIKLFLISIILYQIFHHIIPILD